MLEKLKTRFLSGDGVVGTASASFVVRIIGHATTLVSALLLARLLGVREYGTYMYIFSAANLFALFVVLGMDTLLIRQLVVYIRDSRTDLVRGLLTTVALFALLLCAVCIAALYLLRDSLTMVVNPVYVDYLPHFCVLLTLFVVLRLLVGLTRGIHKPIEAQIPDQIIRRVCLVVGLLVFSYLFVDQLNADHALVILIVSSIVSVCAGLYFVIKLWTVNILSSPATYERRTWLISSVTLAGTTTLQSVVAMLPLLFMGGLATGDSIGLYALSDRIGSTLNLALIASNMAIAGRVAQSNVGIDKSTLQASIVKASRFSFFLALPLGLFFLFFAEELLGVFGEEYRGAGTLLRIMTVGYLIHIAAGPAAVVLQMTHNEKYTLLASISLIFFSIILSYLLIQQYGVLGATISFVFSMVFYKLIILVIVWVKVGVDPSVFGRPLFIPS